MIFRFYGVTIRKKGGGMGRVEGRVMRYGVMIKGGTALRDMGYWKYTFCEVVSTGGAGYVSMSRDEHYFRGDHILYRHRPYR